MKLLGIIFSICVVNLHPAFNQSNELNLEDNVKWDHTYNNLNNIILSGIDTISLDSVFFYKNGYKRIGLNGNLIVEIKIGDGFQPVCSDDGYKLSGTYRKYYYNGKLQEFGGLRCNNKSGEWFYFYENEALKKYENYGTTQIDCVVCLPLLSGIYKEYHPNKQVKLSGMYRMVLKWDKFAEFEMKTYKEVLTCCDWLPTSIKTGIWYEYDEKGQLISSQDFTIEIDKSKIYKDFADLINEEIK
jgi:antitoxin component YwqK of YwqJK toxin-antitoxin module